FKGRRVEEHYHSTFSPDNLIIAAAGNLTHEQLLELVSERFAGLERCDTTLTSPSPDHNPHITLRHKKELEQAHLVIGAPCPSLASDDRYVAYLMASILGGGMSSRLFQSVREDRGLVYTVYAAMNAYNDCGYDGGIAPHQKRACQPGRAATQQGSAEGWTDPQ